MNLGQKANTDAQWEEQQERTFSEDAEQKLRCWYGNLITPKRTPKLRPKWPPAVGGAQTSFLMKLLHSEPRPPCKPISYVKINRVLLWDISSFHSLSGNRHKVSTACKGRWLRNLVRRETSLKERRLQPSCWCLTSNFCLSSAFPSSSPSGMGTL